MYTADLEIDIRIILELARPTTQAIGRRTLAAEAGEIDPRPVYVKFVVDSVALRQDFHRLYRVFRR